MRFACAILLVPILAAVAGAQEAWWDKNYTARRPVVVYTPGLDLPGDDSAIITFYTGGRLKADGSDIRVTGGGKEYPFKLYGVGPGDTVTIGFKVTSDVRNYYVYFGNKDASPSDHHWEPQRGLILETRGLPDGAGAKNLDAMASSWVKGKPFYGADAVDRVWHGQNMFGPSDAFMSHYVGWLVCPSEGRYSFATTSDDASFLLTDGKQVVAWPGIHDCVADCRHNATVTLSRGIHRFEYLHLNVGGTTCAVAAWKRPGGAGYEVIPENAFAPLSKAQVGPMELVGERTPCGFDAEIVGEALITKTQDAYAVKMAFLSSDPAATRNVVEWDFGDGITGQGPAATHVYLNEGLYGVTMTIGSGPAARVVTNRIQVHQHWGWQTRKDIADIDAYVGEISRYDVEKLDGPSCVRLIAIAEDRGSRDFVKRVALSVVNRADKMKSEDMKSVLDEMRRTFMTSGMAADDDVLSACSASFKTATGVSKALLAIAMSDMLLERGQPKDAAAFTKAALSDRVEKESTRRLFIAYGDAMRYAGDGDAARAAFAAADEISLGRSSLQNMAVTSGLAFKAEDYLRNDEYSDAEDVLDQWDWEKPVEKLAGYSSYLRAQVYHAQRRDKRATAEIEALAAASPESPYAPKALLLEAKIHVAARNRAAAKAALDRIVKDYETSPEASDAKSMLKGFGR